MSKITVGFQPGRAYTLTFDSNEVALSEIIAALEQQSGKRTDGFDISVNGDVVEPENIPTTKVADDSIVGASKQVKGN